MILVDTSVLIDYLTLLFAKRKLNLKYTYFCFFAD